MKSLEDFPQKNNNSHIIVRIIGLTLLIGLILGTIGVVYPNLLPIISTVAGLFLFLDALRQFRKPTLVSFAITILGIMILSGVFAGFFQGVLCHLLSTSTGALVNGIIKNTCTQNAAGATAWASGWFMLISAVIIFALFLGNRKK